MAAEAAVPGGRPARDALQASLAPGRALSGAAGARDRHAAGQGGIPGQPRPKNIVKYVVDFEGGKLSQFSQRGDIELEATAPSGFIERQSIYPVVGTNAWRAMFDFTAGSETPVDIRLHLHKGGEVLSETWVFQHLPSLSLF